MIMQAFYNPESGRPNSKIWTQYLFARCAGRLQKTDRDRRFWLNRHTFRSGSESVEFGAQIVLHFAMQMDQMVNGDSSRVFRKTRGVIERVGVYADCGSLGVFYGPLRCAFHAPLRPGTGNAPSA